MLVIIFTVLICFQNLKYTCKTELILPNIAIFLFIIITFLLLCLLFRKLRSSNFPKLQNFDYDNTVKVLTFILFVAQVYISFNIIFDTGWDSGALIVASRLLATEKYGDAFAVYPFSRYPNNLFLLFFETFLIKLNNDFGIFLGDQSLMCIVIVNCIINSSACYLVYKSISLLVKKSFAFLGFLFGVVLFGLSPWTVICYSDSLGLLFPVLSFYYFFKPSKSTVSKYVNLPVAIFSGCLGYFVKPQCAIMLIALTITGFIYNFRFKNKKVLIKFGASAICLVLSLLVINGGINAECKKYGYTPDKNIKFGMTHFLMMGLNEESNGVYSDPDIVYSASFAASKERQQANIKRVIERLKTMGPIGYAKHLTRKILTVYNDGTFAWGAEGNFYFSIPENPNEKTSKLLREIYYTNEQGIYSKYFTLFEQTVWIAVVFFGILAAFNNSSHKDKRMLSTLMLAIIGLTVFELLFEARARYLYTYAPIYCILATLGIKNALNFVNNGITVFKFKFVKSSENQPKK